MLGKCFCLKVEKRLFLIKVSIQNEEMQDFECFFAKLWLRKQRNSDFFD